MNHEQADEYAELQNEITDCKNAVETSLTEFNNGLVGLIQAQISSAEAKKALQEFHNKYTAKILGVDETPL